MIFKSKTGMKVNIYSSSYKYWGDFILALKTVQAQIAWWYPHLPSPHKPPAYIRAPGCDAVGGDEQGGPSPRDLVQEALVHHVNVRILRLHNLLALLLHLVYKHTNITMCSTDEGLTQTSQCVLLMRVSHKHHNVFYWWGTHTNITMCSTDEGLRLSTRSFSKYRRNIGEFLQEI